MIRILAVSEQWWPDGTGGILASHLIARTLRDVGFKLTVVHGTRDPVKLEGVNYIYTSLLNVRNKQRLWLNCLVLAKENWFLKLVRASDVVYIPRYCYPLIPAVKKFSKRVVVHLHDYQPVSYNAIVLKNGGVLAPKGLKDIVELEVLQHGSVLRTLGAATAPLNILCRLWLKGADVILCVSKKQAEIIGKMAPELVNKLKVVYNPLPNVPMIEKDLIVPTFLYVGGDSYFKGFDAFLKSSLMILKKGYSTNFLIAGAFKRRDIKPVISALNREFNSFHLLGYIPYDEVLRLHSRSYALLFPSICEEPLPYAVVESMLAGTMPIASKVGGVPEIVEGTFAERLLFTPNNTHELIERMEYVLSMNHEQLRNIGLSLRKAVLERFDQESIREKLIKALLG